MRVILKALLESENIVLSKVVDIRKGCVMNMMFELNVTNKL